jgi:acetoin:2,6-dichlorophenolindophenol oxidoreductase subunit beta
VSTVLGSLNRAMHRAMERDPRVHLIGEDLLDPYGGAFKFSKGLSSRFEGRVWTTPISEAAIVGVSVGMALRGLRPVAEMMFGDFLTLAADQIVNHAAKFRWMFNDQVRVPMVIRAPMGARRGYGPTHSQTLDKHFLGVPGLWVVSPSIFGDPGVLLEQAIAHEDPVLFIESKTCYGRTLESAPQGMRDEVRSADGEPFPTRRYVWADGGSDGLICCYGATAPFVLEAVRTLADAEGLRFDFAVFTQLSPTPFDHIRWLLERGPRICLFTEEGSAMAGWSAEMLAAFEEQRAGLGQPEMRFARVGSLHEPIGSSRVLESNSIVQTADIVSAALAQV